MIQKECFDLEIELVEELEHTAITLQKEKSEIVSEALKLYMDYHDLQTAIESAKDPKEKPLTHDEFFDGLDI
jgi:hypothetical protein